MTGNIKAREPTKKHVITISRIIKNCSVEALLLEVLLIIACVDDYNA
jgi:hypothetical protein